MNRYILLLSACIAIGISAFLSASDVLTFSQAELSILYATSITPTAITFSIWSVIYISWIALGLLSALGKTQISKKNTYLLAITQIVSSLWLIPAQTIWIDTSLLVMASLIFLLSILFFNSSREGKCLKIVNALFYGWILVAFLANFHIFLIDAHAYFFPVAFGVITLLLGLLYNVYLLHKHDAWIINLVYIWALCGILIKQENEYIHFISLFGILSLTGILILQKYSFFKKQLSRVSEARK